MSNEQNVLLMPDEEFLKLQNQPVETPAVAVVEEALAEVVVETPVVETATEPGETPTETEVAAGATQSQGETPEGEGGTAPVAETPAPEFDYKAAYESIVGRTYKVKGKEIQVKTPEEAAQLIQMGAGFHQNSVKLAQHRKIIETLKEHELLDESKINELIDISKNNPEAIRALVQRAGLEPHQLIPQGDAQPYTPGQHVLPDAQLRFRTSVESINEQGGEEFLTHVAQDWDVASRAEIVRDPDALELMFVHKQGGLYDKISSEVERRKVFDPSMANLPFIHAYLAVGNDMHEKGLLVTQQDNPAPVPAPAPVVTPPAAAPVPVAVKPAVASQPVTPNPAAAKAASVGSAPAPASITPNFLTMPDEEFKKHHMTK